MNPRLTILLSLSFLFVVGCGVDDSGDLFDDTLAGGKADDALIVGERVARHCELFVDKLVPVFDSHSFREYRIFIKSLPERLDGAIAAVGFAGSVEDVDGLCANPELLAPGVCGEVGEGKELFASRFADSSDYFEMRFTVGHAFTFKHRYVGNFFVDTETGSRYLVRAFPEGEIVLDDHGIELLRGDLKGVGYSDFFSPIDVGAIPGTASFYRYMNPDRCE